MPIRLPARLHPILPILLDGRRRIIAIRPCLAARKISVITGQARKKHLRKEIDQ